MATTGSYYLNGPSLTSSTSVFTDSGLTTLAPDGFYSDGVIVREQVGGVLLPAVACSSCESQCLEYVAIAEGGPGSVYYDDCEGNPQTLELLESEEYTFCALSNTVNPTEGIAIIEIGACVEICWTYSASILEGGGDGSVTYTDCNGITVTEPVLDGENIEFCSSDEENEIETDGAVELGIVSTECIL